MSEKTIFEKILAKEIQAKIVYEDDIVLAFKDISPQAPVHVLVIPKRKLTKFSDLKENDSLSTGEYINCIARVAEKLGLERQGYRVVFNCGPDACQSVDYLHAHILGGTQLGARMS